MEERSFVQRNKRKQLREMTDVVTFREEGGTKSVPATDSIPDVIAREVPTSQVRAFEDAGWLFRERAAGECSADTSQAKVFVKGDGHLALGTNLLTVQFREDVSEEQANEMLRPYGCHVVKRLTFAPGLFQVAVTDPSRADAIEVANQLQTSGLVKFAEPELIEVTGPRSG